MGKNAKGGETGMMQEELEARIWQRVFQTPQEGLAQEQLTQWIADSLGAERSYRVLARRTGRRSFSGMAEAERAQARELSALLFLLYGVRGQVLGGAAEDRRSTEAAIRSRYRAETAAQREFSESKQRWAEHAEVLERMERRAARHRALLCREAERLAGMGR